MKLDSEGLKHLASILMGAAYADGDYDGSEAEAIGDILCELVGADNFPDVVGEHLSNFDATSFDLETSARALAFESPRERQALLKLVAQVTEADDVLDLAESNYIHKLGGIIGASDAELDDYTIAIEIVEPPPLPKG